MIGSQQGESVNVSSSSMATQPSFQKLQILLVVVLCDTQRVLHAMQWSLQNNEMIQKNFAKDETNNDAPNEIATAQAVAARCIACMPRSRLKKRLQACTSDTLVSVGTSILLHAYRTADRQLIVSNQSRISASSAEAIKDRGAHSLDETLRIESWNIATNDAKLKSIFDAERRPQTGIFGKHAII